MNTVLVHNVKSLKTDCVIYSVFRDQSNFLIKYSTDAGFFLCNHPLPLNPHEPEKKSLKYLHKQALFILSYI